MKTFVKDYMQLMKHEVGFYKKHWKGCVVIVATQVGLQLAVGKMKHEQDQWDNLRETVKEAREKNGFI